MPTMDRAEPGGAGRPAGWMAGSRYRALSLLKAGSGVDTWLGEGADGRTRVVIKTVSASTVPASVRSRLEHESQVLSRLDSPYLTPIVDVGSRDGLLYLVEPFEPGTTLQERLRAGPLPTSDVLAVARCLLTALREAHAHGVVHRDVKPANVIVADEAPLTRAVLIDFGLARSGQLEASLLGDQAGTVTYMSPEQAGLIDAEVDPRSDLYSLGVLLFECATGKPPFAGRSVTEVLRRHLTVRPPELSHLGIRAPRALDEVIQRLLRKDPRDRYQSAEGALADVTALAEGLARGNSEPHVRVGLHDRRRTLTEPAFVGREAELAGLERAIAQERRGAGGLVLLEAESGGGKTRLLDELAHRSAASVRVLRGRGVAAAAQRPFLLLHGVMVDVVAASRSEPDLGPALRAALGDGAAALCAAFRDLGEIFGPGTAELLGPDTFGEARTLNALAALLEALGRRGSPALVLLDDAQWADDASLKLLHRWHAGREASRGAEVVVVVAFRTEEVSAEHPLRKLQGAPAVVLSPMSPAGVGALAESMAGPLPEEAQAAIAELAEGSPFMATAVLRGMLETGALVPAAGGAWGVDASKIADVRASREAAVFLKHRLEILPPESLAILSIGAVLGRDFEVDIATTLAGRTPAEAREALAEARRRHLVWLRGGGGRCVFAHDKLREAVLDRLPAEDRRRHHEAAARHLEQEAPARSFDIAYHFDAAGAPERALPYALDAARKARASYALEIAEQQYLIARRGCPSGDLETRRELAEGLGEVLMLRGRYEQAVAPFEEARALTRSELEQARLEGKLGELAFKRGDMQTASAAIERGLAMLGRRVPASEVLLLAFCLWEVLVQAAHTLAPRPLLGRRAVAGRDGELLAIHLYSRLAHAYWFQRGRVPTLWAHLREMNLAERYPPTLALAQAYSEHAPVLTMLGAFPRGIAYARRSFEIRRDLGDVWGQGQSKHFLGVVLYAASRFEECITQCREAIELLERTGDRWEINTARWHLAYCRYRLGDLRGAVDAARAVHQSGLDIGDQQATGIGLTIESKASGGRVPAGPLAVELARVGADVHTRVELLQAEAVRLLGERRAGEAVRVLASAQELVDEASLRQEYVAPVLPWLATALRVQVEEAGPYEPARRRALLGDALSAARRAERVAGTYRNNLPHARRERGLLLALHGDAPRARRALDGSLAVAERLGMRAEAAETRRARGRVGKLAGWPDADADLAAGESAMSALTEGLAPALRTAPEAEIATISLAERFDQILEVSRPIATALTKEDVLRTTRHAAVALLRGEECTVVDVATEGDAPALVPAFASETARPSLTILRLALASGRPVVVADPGAEDPGDSVILSGARSVLCAPVRVRGRVSCLLYVTHGRVGRLFGETEERLAEFLAALAGAALENTAGFAEVQAAVRARDEFLSIAAHELRTPLTALTLRTQTMLRMAKKSATALTPELWAQHLADTRRNLLRFERLVDELLDVSRLVEGRLVLSLEEVDLAEVTREACERYKDQLDLARSPLVLTAGTEVPGSWDRLRLEQIVANLLSNAIKFGPGKPIELEVTADRGTARLAVRDHGIGISRADQARIFERFERAVSMRSYGGMGLGLWITRQLVEAMGGVVRLQSALHEGSTFLVELPQARGGGDGGESA